MSKFDYKTYKPDLNVEDDPNASEPALESFDYRAYNPGAEEEEEPVGFQTEFAIPGVDPETIPLTSLEQTLPPQEPVDLFTEDYSPVIEEEPFDPYASSISLRPPRPTGPVIKVPPARQPLPSPQQPEIQEQQPTVDSTFVDLGFDTSSSMYEYQMQMEEKRDRGEISQEEVNKAEDSLVQTIVSDAYIDADSAVPGKRKFDKLAEEIGAESGTFFYDLGDRENYAKFALDRVVKKLHEAGASPSLLNKVQQEYEKTKEAYGDMKPQDVLFMGDKIRQRTAKTYSQLLSIPLMMVSAPLALAVAGASGRPRNTGEADNPFIIKENIETDSVLLDASRGYDQQYALPLSKMANRSYMKLGDGDVIKLYSTDIIHIQNNKKKWQEGLKKHIDKVYDKVFADRTELNIIEAVQSPDQIAQIKEAKSKGIESKEEVYNYLKDLALYSYSDAIDGEYGDFLEGYKPVAAPKGGWVYQAGASNAASRSLGYALDKVLESKGLKPKETAEIDILGFKLEEPEAMAALRAFVPVSPFDSKEDPTNYVDAVPIAAEKENRARLLSAIKAGEFGEEAKKNPEVIREIVDLAGQNVSKYSTQFREFGRNFLQMLGPEETAKATIMSIAGFKKFGMPSLIPGVEVGGILSSDDMLLFGDDDLLPLMKEMGITEKDVEQFWNETPGFAIAMVPGLSVPLGRLGSAAATRVGAGARAVTKAISDPNLTPSQKAKAAVDGYGVELNELNSELYAAQERINSQPREVEVVRNNLEEAIPLEETATNLRNLASESREAANKQPVGDSSRRTLNQVADEYEASARAIDEMNLEKFEHDQAEGTRTMVDEMTPTMERFPVDITSRAVPEGISKRMDELAKAVEAETKLQLQKGIDPEYKSPGEKAYNDALREVANEIDRGRVDKKFKEEFVFGREQSMAEKFVDNGVTDPLAYAYLLEDAGVSGPKGIASYVFRAEQSKFSQAKAKYHQSLKEVARLRGVSTKEVYADVNRMNVIDDMVQAGVTDSNMYAMAGASDELARQKAREAKTKPEKPKVRNKKFGEGVLRPASETVKVRGFGAKTSLEIASDAAYGVARTAVGRRPVNVLENRLNKITGKSPAQKVALLGEASLLSVFEFLQAPFAFVNFPSWFGDFSKYMYHNSTGAGKGRVSQGFFKMMRGLFDYSLSPSAKLGNEMYMKLVAMGGRKTINQFDMDELIRRFGDEGVESVRISIRKALDEVGLSEQAGSPPSIDLLTGNQLSSEMKNKIATAMMAGEGGYIEMPGKNGSQKIYLRDYFDLEYKVNGEWVNAWDATRRIDSLKDQIGNSKARVAELRARQKEIEAARGSSNIPPEPNTLLELAQIESNIKGQQQLQINAEASIADVINSFGSAKDVFSMKDGKMTGVQDIRFSFRPDVEGPIGGVEKTLLGVLNAYVRPMQTKMLEVGANLVAGENTFRLSIAAAKPKDTVTITNVDTGATKVIRTFKGRDAPERAKAMADKINEDYAKKGNKAEVAKSTTSGQAEGDVVLLGKRDLEVDGYNAVGTVADYMSAYFTETALLDFMHSTFKEGLSGDARLARMQQLSKMLIKMYPEDVIQNIKKSARGKNLNDAQVAALIIQGIDDGTIAAASATGSGRFLKERLWAKSMTFDERKDFYALYTAATRKANSQLLKRVEQYRLLNMLRDESLILTKFEIDNTPGVSENQFVKMSDFAKKNPGILDPVEGAYISKNVAESIKQQQNLINNVVLGEESFLGRLAVGTNRFLKRGAVVAYVNGTAARNFIGGIIVQAGMAKHPATMRHMRKAFEANRAIKDGLAPSDPVFRELSIAMGGPGRSVIELDVKRKRKAVQRESDAQVEYMLDLLSGDKDIPGLGVAVNRQLTETKNLGEVARVLGPNKFSDKFSETLKLVSDTADAADRKAVAKVQPLRESLIEPFDSLGDAAVSGYGTIDDVLRLAYAYEMVQNGMSVSDAARLALKVFYDYPDIPPIAKVLRDNVLLGIPFIGYQLWSTKAFGNYYERNPLRAAVLGSLARALNQATEDTMKLSTIYQDVDQQEIKSVIKMPGLATSRTTVSERARLKAAGVPEKERLAKTGQIALDKTGLTVGAQTDWNLLGPLIKAAREGDVSALGQISLLAKSGLASMITGLASTAYRGFTGKITEENRVQEHLNENTESIDGGGLGGGFLALAEPLAQVGGLAISDIRAFSKLASNLTGKPYAGQDQPIIDTLSNVVGLTLRVMDPRLTKETFNDIGQSRIRGIKDALEAFNRRKLQTKADRGPTLYRYERNVLQNQIREFERATNIFKAERSKEGREVRKNIIALMRGMLKYRPDTPQFKSSYLDLLDYYRLSLPE